MPWSPVLCGPFPKEGAEIAELTRTPTLALNHARFVAALQLDTRSLKYFGRCGRMLTHLVRADACRLPEAHI